MAFAARFEMGSFDCIVVRFTDDNFAQDDRRVRALSAASLTRNPIFG